jgi:hypothetical protein
VTQQTNKQASKQAKEQRKHKKKERICRRSTQNLQRGEKEKDEGIWDFFGYLFLISNIHLSCGPGFSFLFS